MVDAVTSPIEGCPNCGGLGFFSYDVFLADKRFGKAVPCDCIMEAGGKRRIQLLIGHSGLDEAGLRDKDFQGFEVQNGNQRAFRAAQRFADVPQGWLMLSGGVGRGKTHLLAAIGNRLLDEGSPVVYANAPRLLGRLKATFDARNDELSFEDRFTGLKEVETLLLDDLGAEYATPWAQTTFFELLDHRYSNDKPTVVASNLKRSSFRGRLGSRLQEATYIELSGPDYRATQRHQLSLVTRKGAEGDHANED